MLSSCQIFLLLVILVVCVLLTGYLECSMINDPIDDVLQEDRFIYVPDANGSLRLVDLLEPIEEHKILALDVKTVTTFYLMTRNHIDEPHIIQYNDTDSFRRTDFVVGKTTVIISHGWRQSYKSMNELAVEFLNDDDVNVVNIDWSRISLSGYITAKSKTSEIGTFVGDFVNWLNITFGVSFDEVHLVGLSLGGQLMGSAGRQTGGKVRKITGLEPAGPLWYSDIRKLQPTDAQYVEAIHTNGFLLGYKYPCGHADVYFNGGGVQPACQLSLPERNVCSHGMSLTYYIISIRYPEHFVARKCGSYSDARTQMFDGEPYEVGTSDLSKYQEGIFEVDTGITYPY